MTVTNTRHPCAWPNCPKSVGQATYMCKAHMSTLPLDLRLKVSKAMGPPKQANFKYVDQEIQGWVENQHPGNYRRGLFRNKDGSIRS